MKLVNLPTPCLLLDRPRMLGNITRMQQCLHPFKVNLRPHVKTAKCAEIARLMTGASSGPITVSTLKEAEQFAAAGFKDILYAVGIVPGKLSRVLELRSAGVDLAVILDNLEAARAVVAACRESGEQIPLLIEIDSDGHRAGIRPEDPLLIEVARLLHEGGALLRGVMTHAGSSYEHPGRAALTIVAERERTAAVNCAKRLREAGLPCPVVSVGSTPTASFASDLTGVTEVRVGVYVFMDLVMAGLRVCTIDDIAISVLTTVIGHQQDKGWILVDGGWMAMSRDRGTASQALDQGYGVVTDLSGRPYPNLVMVNANQEHGIIAVRTNTPGELPDLAVGTQVRILPNHACATAAQFDCYHVMDNNGDIATRWQRFSGW